MLRPSISTKSKDLGLAYCPAILPIKSGFLLNFWLRVFSNSLYISIYVPKWLPFCSRRIRWHLQMLLHNPLHVGVLFFLTLLDEVHVSKNPHLACSEEVLDVSSGRTRGLPNEKTIDWFWAFDKILKPTALVLVARKFIKFNIGRNIQNIVLN